MTSAGVHRRAAGEASFQRIVADSSEAFGQALKIHETQKKYN